MNSTAAKRTPPEELVRMARTGDVDGLAARIRQVIRIPPPVHVIQRPLHDLLRVIASLPDESERTDLLEEIVRMVPSWLDEDWGEHRYVWRDYFYPHWDEWERLARRWYAVWGESLT